VLGSNEGLFSWRGRKMRNCQVRVGASDSEIEAFDSLFFTWLRILGKPYPTYYFRETQLHDEN